MTTKAAGDLNPGDQIVIKRTSVAHPEPEEVRSVTPYPGDEESDCPPFVAVKTDAIAGAGYAFGLEYQVEVR